ncbi:hypothetical protein SAMN05660748_2860 [Blastococcus aggregatus]|uniref:Uncharacterized protein n=1 Tax=Blastococcus aggregatus TaxID=38502 RepID=A0A285VC91_9ACTN|nr:hypothetical protein [Blastococcus aggregatus]SOC50121.1 hypothetical protein SAMN05660748_2860 [Blastococcus aggregatus]
MTEQSPRTGAARDVPPPRPVTPTPAPVEESGLARAARALADAVSGLLGGAEPAPGEAAGEAPGRSARTGLRDVLGAVVTAVGAAVGGGRDAPPEGSVPADGPADDPGRSPGAVLGDLLSAAAPRLPIRDAGRLRAAHPGVSDAGIADALVARSARLTAGIGAATGGFSAAHWFAPPSLLVVPLELGAETLLTAAVEVVLIGELHELHGRPAPGDARARGAAYLSSWSAQRSVQSAAGFGSVLGVAGLNALRRRVGRRLVGSVPAAAPLLLGAALAGRSNRRATETLARRVLRDLRGGA